MAAQAKPSNELAIIVRENLKRITANTRYPKATLADICSVTRSTVSHWFREPNPKLPSIEYLLLIANHYGVMVDSLLTESGDNYINRRSSTYSDAFATLLEFVETEIIDASNINNFILKKLCMMYAEGRYISNISKEELSTWVKDVIERFCIPIPQVPIDNDIIEFMFENTPGIGTMDKLKSLENLAYAVHDVDKLQEAADALQIPVDYLQYREQLALK